MPIYPLFTVPCALPNLPCWPDVKRLGAAPIATASHCAAASPSIIPAAWALSAPGIRRLPIAGYLTAEPAGRPPFRGCNLAMTRTADVQSREPVSNIFREAARQGLELLTRSLPMIARFLCVGIAVRRVFRRHASEAGLHGIAGCLTRHDPTHQCLPHSHMLRAAFCRGAIPVPPQNSPSGIQFPGHTPDRFYGRVALLWPGRASMAGSRFYGRVALLWPGRASMAGSRFYGRVALLWPGRASMAGSRFYGRVALLWPGRIDRHLARPRRIRLAHARFAGARWGVRICADLRWHPTILERPAGMTWQRRKWKQRSLPPGRSGGPFGSEDNRPVPSYPRMFSSSPVRIGTGFVIPSSQRHRRALRGWIWYDPATHMRAI